MKKVLSLFLALVLLLSVLPTVGAEEGYRLIYEVVTVDNVQKALIDGFTGTLPEKLVIPETIDGYPVCGIQTHALSKAPIKEVVIPGSIGELPAASFEMNQTLESVTLGEGITVVEQAFDSCPKLKEVHLPSTLERIGFRAFNSTAIENIDFPAGLKTIGDYAFTLAKLKSIVLPEGLQRIGRDAFRGNRAEGILILPESVEWLGDICFSENNFSCVVLLTSGKLHLDGNPFQRGCILYAHRAVLENNSFILNENNHIITLALEDLPYDPLTATIKDEDGLRYVTSDGKAYIVSCSATGELVVPEVLDGCTVTALLPASFYYADRLTKLTLPDSIEEIGYKCFGSCTATLDRLPKNLKKLGEHAFDNFMANVQGMTITDGTIPEGVKEIPAGCFTHVNFETLVLPAGLETIGENAFSETGVREITFLGGVKSIGIAAFAGSAFREVEIPEGLERLGSEAFAYCDNLEKLVLPRSLTEIGEGALGYNENGKLTVYGYTDTPLLDFCQNQRIPFVDRETGEPVPMVYEKKVEGVIYLVDPYRKTATVVGCVPEKLAVFVEIPETVDDCNVTKMAPGALHDLTCRGLILPDTMTYIAGSAIMSSDDRIPMFLCMPNAEVYFENGYQDCEISYFFLPESFSISEDCNEWMWDILNLNNRYTRCVGYEKHLHFVDEASLVRVDGVSDDRLMLTPDGVYRLDDKEYTAILFVGTTLPDDVGGIPVTRVASSCVFTSSYLALGENVRVVEDGAFSGYDRTGAPALRTIYAPEGVEYMPADYYPYPTIVTMLGYSGSYAEKYAKEHQLVFGAIDKTPFADVPENAWYFPYVRDVYWAGLMNGTSTTTFEPDATTTRAMVVQVLFNLAGEEVGHWDVFTDVKYNDWYYRAVCWAYACGVSTGTTETTFSPNAPVTREQLAAFLYRFTTLCGFECKERGDLSKFADRNQISSYATDAIAWAVGVGIINGTSPTTVAPRNNATRAEIAAMLCRLLDYIGSNLPTEES